MSSVQTPAETDENATVDLPADMTKAEAVEACKRTAERDNAMSELASALLDSL